MTSTRIRSVALLACVAVAGVALAGCGVFGGTPDTVAVSDPGNMFHFKIPEKWQSNTEQGFLSVYAGKQLPAPDQPAEELSILVFTSSESTKTSESDMLAYLIDTRAEQRKWTNVKKGTVETVEVGGKKGYSVDVSATGADGATFESRYYFVRTDTGEVFVVAIAPDGEKIADYGDELTDITTEWYWHTGGSTVESLEKPGAEEAP